MDVGVFIPIGNNGWIASANSPQYKPTFELNRSDRPDGPSTTGFDFALSMIKLHGYGGPTEYWDYNLEFFTLMAGLAAVTTRIKLLASVAVLTLPPAMVARMAVTINSIAPGPLRRQYRLWLAEGRIRPDGAVAGRCLFRLPLRLFQRIRRRHEGAVGEGRFRLQRALSSP